MINKTKTTINIFHVSSDKLPIKNKQLNAPSKGINGTNGVLNPLFTWGYFFLKAIKDIQTKVYVNKKAILAKLANCPRLKNPANKAPIIPTVYNAVYGTSFLSTLLNNFGNNPSLLIAKSMCDVVKFPANITARIPITVPKDTTKATPLCPTNFKA